MALEVGTITETVTVASEAQLLQTDKADVQHRAEVGRDHGDAAQPLPQLPGAHEPGAGNDADGVRQRGDGHAGAVARHQRQRSGEHEQLDPHRRRHEHEHLAAEPQHVDSPAETIDTVNISTSSFDAEQGMAGGAAVTVITKSGTNQFRGSGVRVLQRR